MKKKTSTPFRELSFQKKLVYIWDYYKFVIALLICLIAAGYSILSHILAPDPSLYIGFVNVGIGDKLKSQIITDYPDKILTYENLILTDETDKENVQYVYASQTKILATIDGELFDLVILDEEALSAFGQNGYLMNMKAYMEENLPELASSLDQAYVTNIDLSEEKAEEYPMAIDISSCPAIQKAGFTEPVYLAIIGNTPRSEEIKAYLTFFFSIN